MQSPTRSGFGTSHNQWTERTFGELLSRFRLGGGLSRLQLADRVLCSENYIYRLESSSPRNRRVPSPWLVRVLSEALRLNDDQGAALLEARDRLEVDTVDARDRLRTVACSILDRRSSPTEESLPIAGQRDHQQQIAPGAVVLQGFRAGSSTRSR